ncbi:hypothetical protein KIW84_054759 [Lathyrus oleraceus]|uniref:Uncharacterized protein n=1 Tax=Pisum sativum TaxID=3888 RepID=A0A9D4WWP6_PEA|nr:hypothetical protein KIW84_054759 [Pisum sativum]
MQGRLCLATRTPIFIHIQCYIHYKSWEVNVQSFDMSIIGCVCNFDVEGLDDNHVWTFESTFASKRYCIVVIPCSPKFPSSDDLVTSFVVGYPSTESHRPREFGFANDHCSSCSTYILATGCSDDSLKLCKSNHDNLSTLNLPWELVGMFIAHNSPVKGIRFTDCGQKVATFCSRNDSNAVNTIHIWDAINMIIAGTFILEDTLTFESDVITLKWSTLGTGELLLGVCLQNELQLEGHGLRIVCTVTELEGLMGLLADTISVFACRNNIADVHKPAAQGQCCILQDKTCLNICVTRKLMKLQKDIIFKYAFQSNAAHANLIASIILKTKDSGSTDCAGTFGHHSRSERKYFMKNLDKTFDSQALYDTFSTITHPVFCKMATVGSGQSKVRLEKHWQNERGLTWDPIMRVSFNVRHNGFSKDESSDSADNSEFSSITPNKAEESSTLKYVTRDKFENHGDASSEQCVRTATGSECATFSNPQPPCLLTFHASALGPWQAVNAYDVCARLCLHAWAMQCMNAPNLTAVKHE